MTAGTRRAAVYDRFWRSMGGGERHAGMIAQVLSDDPSVEVDLLGHDDDVDPLELGERLGLDLSRCHMRVLPDRGEAALGVESASYDLFVNATYMSRVTSRAQHSAYLCYFPTPVDHDLSTWRRNVSRVVGPPLRKVAGDLNFAYGLGWFPPEGGRRRRWTWTSGSAVLSLAPGPARVLQADFARVGSSGSAYLTVTDGDGSKIAGFEVTNRFVRQRIQIPATEDGTDLHLESDTFVPAGGDRRTLGVAVSRLRVQGTRNVAALLASRVPWVLRDPSDVGFLESYDTVLANSEFTRGWIGRYWDVPAEILYPPIDVDGLEHATVRSKTILTVGRFFPPGMGHSKRQLDMVEAFGAIRRKGGLDGWELVVVGGCEPSQQPYLEQVEAAAAGLPVSIHPNAPRSLVRQLIATASIFWSATGLGTDEDAAPWTQEHFGMTTVEAMAGGCVPVVIDRAGQREIVRHGLNGFRWSTLDDLANLTMQVAGDERLRARLADAAIDRAHDFSDEAFARRWRELVAAYRMLEPGSDAGTD